MFPNLTRREFIETSALAFLAVNTIGLLPVEKVFAAEKLSVKTRYGRFNGFIDKNGVKRGSAYPTLNRP